MTPLDLLLVPWRSTHRSMRWMAVGCVAFFTLGALVSALATGLAGHWLIAISLYAFGLFYVWTFFFSTTLMLAIDARQLRIPGVQRRIVFSLALYGLLSVAAPAIFAAVCGQPIAVAALIAAAVSIGGLLFALLPRYAAIFIGILPSLSHLPRLQFALPGSGDPRRLLWSIVATLLLLAITVLRWRQMMRMDSSSYQGWKSPLVLQFRDSSWGSLNSLGDSRLLLQKPGWLMPRIDLDGVGPEHPCKALRVALGGWYLPQTAASYIRQLSAGLLMISLPPLCSLLLIHSEQHDAMAADVLRGTLIGGFGSLSLVVGPLVCLFSLLWLRRRWRRANAELPLLALLPGLGETRQAKRQLLRAGLGLPLAIHALPIALVLLALICWHNHVVLLSLLLLAQLISVLLTCALLLNVLGGRPLSWWVTGITLILVFVLNSLSASLPLMAWGRHPMPWAVPLLPAVALAWLLLGAAMLWLVQRGWRGLQQLPHPFLPL